MLEWLDPTFIIQTLGLAGILAIVFAESGLFFGFIFPGDSLLVTAGIVAAAGHLNIWWLVPGCFLAAVLGDNVGYAFGRRVGPALFNRPDSRLFKKEYLVWTERYYARYGKKTLVIARFVPVVRSFAPILAGVAQMPYGDFMRYNVLGAFVWAVGLTLLGYTLGQFIPNVDQYLLPIIVVIVLISFAPILGKKFRPGL